MTAKYFLFPFAVSGNVAPVPNTTSDGTVNYQNGYGPDYSLVLGSDPSALVIERTKFNQLMNDVTTALQQYQQFAVPDFITSTANGGTAFSYSIGARVRYDPGTGPLVYESIINANTNLPSVTASWRQINNASSSVIWGGSSAGTANALTFAPSPGIASYTTGMLLSGEITTTNTSSAVTINFNSIGNLTVKKSIGGANVALAVGDQQAGTSALYLYDGTNAILMNPRTYSHAASIATSGTLILDTATGDYVPLTGTTTVTAVTLQEGREVTCVSAGAFTLTNGASLILPTAGNISVVAGDAFVLRGEASGVVRLVNYQRASGTPLVATTAAQPVEGSFLNLKLAFVSTTTLSAAWDEIIAKTALGGTANLGASGSFTLNAATTGINGLDTGTLAASTFYSVYAAFNPTSSTWGVFGCTEVASNAEIYAGTHLPSGYTETAYIGWFQTDGSSHIKSFYQFGRQTWFPKQNALNVTTSVTSFASVSLSTLVPLKAKTVGGTVGTTAVVGSIVAIASDSSGTAELVWGFQPASSSGTALDNFGSSSPFPNIPLITAQTIYYKTATTSDNARIDISTCTF